MVHFLIPDGYEFLVGIGILAITLPIFLHKFRVIRLRNPFRKKTTYGKRFGYGDPK